MNPTDKKLLIGVTVISVAGYLYMLSRKKTNPIKILGLDADNSMKFVAGVYVLSSITLLYHTVVKKHFIKK